MQSGGEVGKWVMSGADVAVLLGVHASTVTRWIDDGMPAIERGAGGGESRIDARAAVRWALQRVEVSGDPGAKARAAFNQARADREQLRLAKDAGMLVLAADVDKAATLASRAMRDAMLSIPERVSSLLAAESDAARVHAILANEIRQALTALADGLARQAEGVDT
jgi:phage terminase Nu1 subunit (DNA packaging protein)